MQRLVLVHTKTTRVLHWFNMLCITLLTLTGFYIHNPLGFNLFANMDTARKIHFVAMYLVLYGVLIRIYYAVYKGEYRNILFTHADIKGLLPLAKYYLFLSDKPYSTGKYNPGQKLVYTSWVLLIAVQAVSGFILYFPTELAGPGDLLGGIVLVRQVHYLVSWVFVYTVTLHVYMGLISGWDIFRSIITGYIPGGPPDGDPDMADGR